MIRAIIIDDEKHCCDSLSWQLEKYCPEIKLAAVCNSATDGIEQIKAQDPQLVFLDVEMPGGSGFEMLEKIREFHFNIIFTTAFDQYALRAIKFGALDYLMKPIDKDELKTAVEKYNKQGGQISIQQLTALLTHTRKNTDHAFQKIALHTLHSFELVSIVDILFCESNSNYTNVHLKTGKNIVVSKTLKEIEELLNGPPFFRVHHSYLVNLQFAIRYIKGEGGTLVLLNEISIPVSRNKKEELLQMITQLSP
jgi:two-component system, LytTR family, response regulator